MVGEVSTLKHELGNHAVEDAALVAVALLSSAQGAEVLGGAGHVGIELEGHALGGSVADLDVEENVLQDCKQASGADCRSCGRKENNCGVRGMRGLLTGTAICFCLGAEAHMLIASVLTLKKASGMISSTDTISSSHERRSAERRLSCTRARVAGEGGGARQQPEGAAAALRRRHTRVACVDTAPGACGGCVRYCTERR